MGVIVAPIVEGKLDAWKEWIADITGPRAAEMKDFNRRYGITSHRAYLAETPSGPVVVAVHDGPGGDGFVAAVAGSDHPFDASFKAKVLEVHGLDVTQPPPGPPPELMLDSGQ